MRVRLSGFFGPPRVAIAVALAVGLFLGGLLLTTPAKETDLAAADELEKDVTQGALRVKSEEGPYVECPLKHTDVKAEVSGFIARVKVRQTFYNPYNEKIEAVYVFPLPHTAAVDDMTMVIGERRIVGVIKRRAAARLIYEEAVAAGLTAALLEQERPNIFTQTVGNIKPHEEINIEISYVDVLKYDMGTYEFHFPMVVGPRYIPGAPISKKPEMPDELKGKVGETEQEGVEGGRDAKGTGWSADTDRVDDASRITPPVLKPGYRTGHDISLTLRLDAGVPIQDLKVVNHEAEVELDGKSGAAVALSSADSIPNKDFVVKYGVVGEKPEMAVLSYCPGEGQGYFMLMIQPKVDEKLAKAPPREICFLIDVSGSMSGEPTEKVKEAMRQFFKLTKPEDTIQVVTFAGQARQLFDKYVPADEEHIAAALNFTQGIRGGGGTEMLKGIKMVLANPPDPKRVRIVVMLTDGFIGNEAEIISEVGKRAGDQVRFWTIGIGSSPNRFLIDGVAKTGGGMSAVLELKTDPTEMVQEIMERIHRAQFANIKIDWKGLPVFETYPARVPELWAGRPVIVYGRYESGGKAKIELNGTVEGEPLTYSLDVAFPDREADHDVLSKVWARQKIEDLSAQTFYGDEPAIVEEITQLALDYRLMSQYTSFVAVDESERGTITEPPTPPRRMLVPVPLPEGVSYEGIFGPLGEGEELAGGVTLKLDLTSAVDSGWSISPNQRMVFAGTRLQTRGDSGALRPMKQAEAVRVGRLFATAGPSRFNQQRLAHAYFGRPSGAVVAGGGGGGPQGAQFSLLFEEGKSGYIAAGGVEVQLASVALRTWSDQRHKEAGEALKKAGELKEAGDLEGAMARYQQAVLLERAYLLVNPWNDDGTLAKATEGLTDVSDEIAKARTKELAALGTRLDLVIRDKSVAEALDMIAKAAGFKTTMVKGSLEDACRMLGVNEARVTYLDLRRATAAQALDWLLTPARLTWRMGEGNAIVVGTSRRLGGTVAWVYPVGDLAFPAKDELEGKDQQEVVKAALEEFLKGVRVALGQKDDSGLEPGTAVLIGPGELLVYGDKATHERVAAFLEALGDPEADIVKATGREVPQEEQDALKVLQATTAKRWAIRTELREKRIAWRAKAATVGALDQFGWQLLAGACRGDVDDEALTELAIAWNSPQCAEILESPNAWLAMRDAWILVEASRTVPENKALRALATKALGAALEHAETFAEALKKEPKDARSYMAALYARLALEHAKEFGVDVPSELSTKLTLLLIEEHKEGPLAPMATLTHMLLVPSPSGLPPWPNDGPTKVLSELAGSDDVTVLAALAARRIGGDAWLTFRQEMDDLVGGRPLDGNVVVIVNRLATAQLALVEK